MDNEAIQKLQSFINKIDDGLISKQEFSFVFEAFLSVLKELRKNINSSISDNNKLQLKNISDMVSKNIDYVSETLSQTLNETLSNKSNELVNYTNKQCAEMCNKMLTDIENIRQNIPTLPDLSIIESKVQDTYKKIEDIENKKPEEIKPEFIRDQLEKLHDEDRLDASAIKDLKKYIDEQINKIGLGKTVIIGGGNSGGGRIVKSYDLSSSLNGSTKTFSLPAFYRIISVNSTSSPIAFRENIDWTADASAMTITFTSQITASTTLASGQTLNIIYSEA